jgi:hypothetical protein
MSRRRVWLAVRWGLITIALIAMNLAAAAWALKTGTAMVGLPDLRSFPPIGTFLYHEGLDGSWVRIVLDPTTCCPSDWALNYPATRGASS